MLVVQHRAAEPVDLRVSSEQVLVINGFEKALLQHTLAQLHASLRIWHIAMRKQV
jgi:hypothetical protein